MGLICIPGKKNNDFQKPDKDFLPFQSKSYEENWGEISSDLDFGSIFAIKECESTMDALLKLPLDDVAFQSLISQVQLSGRGQYNRQWISKKGNLTASFKLPFILNEKWSENFIPLIIGNLLWETFDLYGIKTDIKWPNDMIFQGKKIGGILVEKKDDFYCVGVGVNLSYAPDSLLFDSDFSIPAVSLREKGIKISSAFIFWQTFMEQVYKFFNKRLAKEMPSDLISSLIQKLVWLDDEVFVRSPLGKTEKALLKGLSEDGGLVLEKGGEKIVIYSGNIRAVNIY